MQNVQQKRRSKENLAILYIKPLGDTKKRMSIESNTTTNLSSRNESKNRINIEKIYEKKKTRFDNFGQEIKKGGKHKIVFADELHKVKTIDFDKNIIKKGNVNNKNNKRRNSFPKCKVEKKEKKEKIERCGIIKRNNSFDICKRYLKYHLKEFCISSISNKKPDKFINLDIIDFESTKKENKLNTYFFRKNIVVPDEDNVCCSCYCSIF